MKIRARKNDPAMKKKDIIIIALALLAALALYLVSQVSLGAEASVVVVTVGSASHSDTESTFAARLAYDTVTFR